MTSWPAADEAGAPDPLPTLTESLIAVDTEHRGLGRAATLAGIAVADSAREWYLPCGHALGRQHDPEVVRRWGEQELRDRHVVFRNAKDDLEVLRRFGLDLEALGVVPHEVQHAAALLDDRRRTFTLEALAQDRLGRGKRPLSFPPAEIWARPPAHSAAYAREDSRLTYDLWQGYQPDISREDLGRVLALEDSLLWATLSMERLGLRLDLEKLERWRGEVREALYARVLRLHRLTGLRVNADSGPDMEKLFRRLGLADQWEYTAGTVESAPRPSFSEELLSRLAPRHPEVQLALEQRQLGSLLSKYLDKYAREQEGGTLYYQLHQLRADEGGTITGRYASSKVNIQQVRDPAKQVEVAPVTARWIVRELFLPPAGEVLYDADASQIEYRLFAHYSSVPWPHSTRLIEAYRQDPNLSFHKFVHETILKRCMIYKHAKNFNFMKLYGGGRNKTALMLGRDPDDPEVERIIAEYDAAFPEAKRLLRFCWDLAERRRYVRTVLGRRRRFQEGDRFYSALNCVLQGGAADVMKLALKACYDERARLGYTQRVTVHDQTTGSLPDARLAAGVTALLNEQRLKFRVPILWEGKAGKNWRETSEK